jgi:hypothetical protein
MKTSYLFIAILLSSVFAVATSGKGAKTGLAVFSGVAALYGLVRIFG